MSGRYVLHMPGGYYVSETRRSMDKADALVMSLSVVIRLQKLIGGTLIKARKTQKQKNQPKRVKFFQFA